MPLDLDRLHSHVLADPDEVLRQLDKVDAESSFADFARVMWPVIEPATPLRWGWALDAMCEHLEAVHKGWLRNLCLNVPPGLSKSTLTGVLFPAWEWGPRDMAHLRYLCISYSQDVTLRDNMKCRRVVVSEPFQRNWGDRVSLVGDQNTKGFFETSETGFKLAGSVTGGVMGKRGDRVVFDDLNNTKKVDSVAETESVLQFLAETSSTRYNGPESATINIQQRTMESDATAHLGGIDFFDASLVLPMEFEKARACTTVLREPFGREPAVTFTDPRTEEGELLFPDLFPEARVEEMKRTMRSWGGEFAVAGQLQQRPIPRGGGIFKREWFKPWEDTRPMGRRVRGWDLAGSTRSTSPYTAAVLLCLTDDGRIVIEDVARDRVEAADLDEYIVRISEMDGREVGISVPADPGQAGKHQVSHVARRLHGYHFHSSQETGDKAVRASPFASQAKLGNVYYIDGPWVRPYLAEIGSFPRGLYKDQVDATSRAYARVIERVVRTPPAAGMVFQG